MNELCKHRCMTVMLEVMMIIIIIIIIIMLTSFPT
jgi:hypothetical protein